MRIRYQIDEATIRAEIRAGREPPRRVNFVEVDVTELAPEDCAALADYLELDAPTTVHPARSRYFRMPEPVTATDDAGRRAEVVARARTARAAGWRDGKPPAGGGGR